MDSGEKCTKMDVFKVLMDKIDKEVKLEIVLVVENFLSDAVGGERSEGAISRTVDGKMKEFQKVVKTAVLRLPVTAFAKVETMRRPGL